MCFQSLELDFTSLPAVFEPTICSSSKSDTSFRKMNQPIPLNPLSIKQFLLIKIHFFRKVAVVNSYRKIDATT
jgi:hypothetical protein